MTEETPPRFSDEALVRAFASLDDDGIAPTYDIGPLIETGGMASVHVAEQLTPIRRRVAMKILRWKSHGRGSADRLAKEATALARLTHPSIPKVFDRGVLPDGRAFITMELVEGAPLAAWCDARRATVDDRLRLVAALADALAYAHARGIVHRDVKVGNVLVSDVDGVPTPRLLDFGIAKSLDDDLDGRPTTEGVILGTIETMAPEQIQGDHAAIGPATDVYGLGVLLMELVSGQLPHDSTYLRSLPPAELQRHLTLEDAPSLARRFADAGARRPEIAEARSTTVPELDTALRGDLAAIVAKCLERVPSRRYTTMRALADDLRARLDDRPVSARPPSTFERALRFARRHRVAATWLTAAALVLSSGLALTTWLWRTAEASAEREAALRSDADRQRREAEAARDDARRASSDLNIALQFVVALLGKTGERRPAETLTAIAEESSKLLESWVFLSPGAEAAVREALGAVHYVHKNWSRSKIEFERALRLLKAHDALSKDRDRWLRSSIIDCEANGGDPSIAVVAAESLLAECREDRPPDPTRTARAQLGLGRALAKAGRTSDALAALDAALAELDGRVDNGDGEVRAAAALRDRLRTAGR